MSTSHHITAQLVGFPRTHLTAGYRHRVAGHWHTQLEDLWKEYLGMSDLSSTRRSSLGLSLGLSRSLRLSGNYLGIIIHFDCFSRIQRGLACPALPCPALRISSEYLYLPRYLFPTFPFAAQHLGPRAWRIPAFQRSSDPSLLPFPTMPTPQNYHFYHQKQHRG
ncbi:hypothetical protein VTL71DRAFT_15249 [Oculimacula yallundae]|uniref:Uncharacterized protein n=1 Tax=Oculimacula yallundae TaxID=86028 RepID=A0ABR4CI36_9HELO